MESAKAGFMNHPLSLRGRKRSHVVLLLAPLLATGSLAQTKKEESVVSLERFVSEAVRQEDSVIPTIRPISSVLGRAGSVLDAPRAVSTITKAQLEERNVQRIEDLSQFVAGAFTAPIFGNAGVPTLRGDLGEAYQNGQRKAFNRNSFPYLLQWSGGGGCGQGGAARAVRVWQCHGWIRELCDKGPVFRP